MNQCLINQYLGEIRDILSFGGRSPRTIISYQTYVAPFLEHCVSQLHIDPAEVSSAQIRSYLITIQKERNLSDATINHAISEIRFFCETVLGIPWNPKQVPHRKTKRFLPFVPDRETVRLFLSSISDLKKKAMACLLYSSGLRISEVCRLQCADIEHSLGRIYIAPSKNGRDRYVILAEESYEILCRYWLSLPAGKRSRNWLFTQQTDLSKPIYPQFLQDFIKKQVSLLGWEHRLTAHSFRHAFATHCYQDGMDLLTLSKMLGHSSLHSTTIYVHLAELGMQHYSSPMKGMEVR
jgi:site-specific recombinase XerD